MERVSFIFEHLPSTISLSAPLGSDRLGHLFLSAFSMRPEVYEDVRMLILSVAENF